MLAWADFIRSAVPFVWNVFWVSCSCSEVSNKVLLNANPGNVRIWLSASLPTVLLHDVPEEGGTYVENSASVYSGVRPLLIVRTGRNSSLCACSCFREKQSSLYSRSYLTTYRLSLFVDYRKSKLDLVDVLKSCPSAWTKLTLRRGDIKQINC